MVENGPKLWNGCNRLRKPSTAPRREVTTYVTNTHGQENTQHSPHHRTAPARRRPARRSRAAGAGRPVFGQNDEKNSKNQKFSIFPKSRKITQNGLKTPPNASKTCFKVPMCLGEPLMGVGTIACGVGVLCFLQYVRGCGLPLNSVQRIN